MECAEICQWCGMPGGNNPANVGQFNSNDRQPNRSPRRPCESGNRPNRRDEAPERAALITDTYGSAGVDAL
jgi:hypothetical protein